MSATQSTALGKFQSDFAHALRDPDALLPPSLARLVAQPGFAVYRNTVLKGRIDALHANFPSIARIVGDEWLRAAAAVYARSEPPSAPMLMTYGAGFADFLARFEPAAALPYLPAVALVDRLWSEAHVAADAEPLAAVALHALMPGDMARFTLRPHPAARWAWSDEFPLHSLWSRNRSDAASAESAAIDWRGEGVLLTRPHGAVRGQPLSRGGAALLDACAQGRSIEHAVAAALSADPAADVGTLIGRCMSAGAFSDIAPTAFHIDARRPA